MRNSGTFLIDRILSKPAYSTESGLFLLFVLIVHAGVIMHLMAPKLNLVPVTQPMTGILVPPSSGISHDIGYSKSVLPEQKPEKRNRSFDDKKQIRQQTEKSLAPINSVSRESKLAAENENSSGQSSPALSPPSGAAAYPLVLPNGDASHLNNPKPPYPRASRLMGEEGEVLLSVYILTNGKVGKIKLKKSSGYERLDEIALSTVRNWHYIPAHQDGKAIPYWYTQAVIFSLND